VVQYARGGAFVKKATQYFIDHSGLEAKEVAQEILTRAGNQELYIILPKSARKLWQLKRLAPTWFRNKVTKEFNAALKKSMKRS